MKTQDDRIVRLDVALSRNTGDRLTRTPGAPSAKSPPPVLALARRGMRARARAWLRSTSVGRTYTHKSRRIASLWFLESVTRRTKFAWEKGRLVRAIKRSDGRSHDHANSAGTRHLGGGDGGAGVECRGVGEVCLMR